MIQQPLLQRVLNPLMRQMANGMRQHTAPPMVPAMRSLSNASTQLSKPGHGMSELDLFNAQRAQGIIKPDLWKPSRHGAGRLDVTI